MSRCCGSLTHVISLGASKSSLSPCEEIRVNHIYEIKTPPAHSEMSWGYTSDLVDFSVLGR